MKFAFIGLFLQLALLNYSYSQISDTIKVELESQYWQSLKSRKEIGQMISGNSQDSSKIDSLIRIMHSEDSTSLGYVKKIINEYGWLGTSEVGSLANNSIFYTIQHSDLATMKLYYPLFEKSVEEGESNRINLALMEDRILVRMDLPQKYGTQSYYDDHGLQHLKELDDLDAVNKRRRKIGLKSLNKQLKRGELIID